MRGGRKAWVVSIEAGYGHERAAYPLKDIAFDKIIRANNDSLLSKKEQRLWRFIKTFYEWVSRLTSIPMIGRSLFGLYDRLQSISSLYPIRDLSSPTLGTRYLDYMIKKRGLNKNMFEEMKMHKIPVVCTHFIPALAADNAGIEKVFCIVTDTDINRAWVANNPKKSRIVYLAPCEHAIKRLREYGVADERILYTGFPLPKENLGGKHLVTLKKDLGMRLPNLDPKHKHLHLYEKFLKDTLGSSYRRKKTRPVTLTYAIGGAGAQREIALKVLNSLKDHLKSDTLRINLSAGTRVEVAEEFRNHIIKMGLRHMLGRSVNIIFAWNKKNYFHMLNIALRTSDILWTKPSEMSFYAGLGIPIIISPPIGAHEFYNQKWLLDMGAAFNQEDPSYTKDWLFDLIDSGRLAEAAFKGFLEAPKLGTYNIETAVFASPEKARKLFQP